MKRDRQVTEEKSKRGAKKIDQRKKEIKKLREQVAHPQPE